MTYLRGDSMILTFHVPPLTSGQELCDIDRVYVGVPQKNFKMKIQNFSFPESSRDLALGPV